MFFRRRRPVVYTLTAITRFQANEFFEQTERLPEVVLDINRTPIFNTGIFYEGETGGANLIANSQTSPDSKTTAAPASKTFIS